MLTLSPSLLGSALAIAKEAGKHLQDFYQQSFALQVQVKQDNTPVTEADLFISRFLTEQLSQLTPNIPVLSEENCTIPFAQRQQWSQYWLIDPLDGTQQFIDRTDQFAILISLLQANKPVLGIIHAPVLGYTFYAMKNQGAYKQTAQKVEKLPPRLIDLSRPLKIAVGSSYCQHKVRSILQQNIEADFMVYGSSGLKSTLVAEGLCDCYVRLGKTGEWDTAASEIILQEMGGKIIDIHNYPLTYNKRETLVNPHFIMLGQAEQDWQKVFRF